MRASKLFKIWSVYVMAAPAKDGQTYFKVGRTSDVGKRVGAVQTGCPLKITKAWVLSVWDAGASIRLEWQMHEALKDFRSHGEWFAMTPSDPAHKKAMNEAFAQAVRFASQGAEIRWRELSVKELREAMAQQASDAKAKRKEAQGRRIAFATTMMARAGRRIL